MVAVPSGDSMEKLTERAMDRAKLFCLEAGVDSKPVEKLLMLGVLAGISATYEDLTENLKKEK